MESLKTEGIWRLNSVTFDVLGIFTFCRPNRMQRFLPLSMPCRLSIEFPSTYSGPGACLTHDSADQCTNRWIPTT